MINLTKKPSQILLVEDEILIADTIKRYLLNRKYQVSGSAISYEEAERLYRREKPDLVLIDIRLNGPKTGIDFAHFLQKQSHTPPFIYLTSQLDQRNLSLAKETLPSGYLTKPIQKASLYTTIEIALHNHQKQKRHSPKIDLSNGPRHYSVNIHDILYLQAEHIYVKVHFADQPPILHRGTLKELLDRLPEGNFIQTHRSFAINIKKVTYWDQANIYIGEQLIPVSRTRRKIIYNLLK